EVPASVTQAVAQDRPERLLGKIPIKTVAHLDGRPALALALRKHPGQILPRMLAAGEKEGDPVPAGLGDDPGGEGAGALLLLLPLFVLLEVREDPHGRVIIVEHLSLGRLADELLVDRKEILRPLPDDIPLGLGREGNAEVLLEVGKS